MLTAAEKKEIDRLEQELERASSPSYDHNYKQEYLTKPTEESYLKKIGRLASQIPRGVIKGVAELADIPYAAYSLATKKELPKESLGEKTNDFLDKYATWSSPEGKYGKGLQNLTSDLVGLKGISRAGKIASKAGAKRVGSILHQPGHVPLVSTAGSSLATSVERDDPHHKNAGLGISSLMGSFSANAALKAGKGAYRGWKTAKSLRDPNYLQSLDKLPLQAIESYKKRTRDQYNTLMTPIEQEIADKKGKVSLQGVIAPLEEKLNQFETYQGRRQFLKDTQEGKILESLMQYPREVSYPEAKALGKSIAKKADSLGAFEPHKTATGKDLSDIAHNFRKALEDSVGKQTPDSLENYKAAKALWKDRREHKMPLIEQIEREGMVPSKGFHNSLKESKENAAHARFVLDNLEGADKKKYALDVIKSGALKNAGLPHTKSGLLKSLPELIKKRPHHHQVFYEAIEEKNRSPLGKALTPRSVSVINALKSPLRDPYERHKAAVEAEIRELEEELGLSPPGHAQGGTVSKPDYIRQLEALKVRGERYKQELAHFNPKEMAFLKANPGLVQDVTNKYKSIAKKGQGNDTKLGRISKKTAKALDQLIHHGHEHINERTGLREYMAPNCPHCPGEQHFPEDCPNAPGSDKLHYPDYDYSLPVQSQSSACLPLAKHRYLQLSKDPEDWKLFDEIENDNPHDPKNPKKMKEYAKEVPLSTVRVLGKKANRPKEDIENDLKKLEEGGFDMHEQLPKWGYSVNSFKNEYHPKTIEDIIKTKKLEKDSKPYNDQKARAERIKERMRIKMAKKKEAIDALNKKNVPKKKEKNNELIDEKLEEELNTLETKMQNDIENKLQEGRKIQKPLISSFVDPEVGLTEHAVPLFDYSPKGDRGYATFKKANPEKDIIEGRALSPSGSGFFYNQKNYEDYKAGGREHPYPSGQLNYFASIASDIKRNKTETNPSLKKK